MNTLEAKDRNARGQGQEPRTQRARVFQKLLPKEIANFRESLGNLRKKKVFIKFPRGLWRASRRQTNMVMTSAHFQQIKN